MSVEPLFGLKSADQIKLDAINLKIQDFIARCMLEGDQGKMLAPSFIAAGCDMLETALGSHEKAVHALKALFYIFQNAKKRPPPDASDSLQS
jgi:hypothetical protein